MIFDILDKWKYVHVYDQDANTDIEIINDILYKSWKTTPSKNSFMPYKVHVAGPDQSELKKKIYYTTEAKEHNSNARNSNPNPWDCNPNKTSILSSEYVLVFTPRAEDQPSPWQQHLHDNGCWMDAWYEDNLERYKPTILVEVGLFAHAVTSLCLEQGLDTNYISSFERGLKYWEDMPFVTQPPCLIMTIGKAKKYRRQYMKEIGWDKGDVRPNYERIVNFV